MPIYPDMDITIDGARISWSRLMNNPVLLQKTMDTLVNKRLLGHRVLTQRIDMTGVGLATIETEEPNGKTYKPERVSPGAQYPKTQDQPGTLTPLESQIFGYEEDVPDALVSRGRGDIVARKLIKMANTHAVENDKRVLSAVASVVTQSYAVTSGAWNTTGADPFADLVLAAAQAREAHPEFNYTNFVCAPTKWAQLVTRAKVIDRAPREGNDPLLLTGRLVRIAGFTVWETTDLPPGITAFGYDPDNLGGIGYEDIPAQSPAPAWTGSPRPAAPTDPNPTAGVQTRRRPIENGADGVTIGSRMVQVPSVDEPNAAFILTGA